MEQLTLDKRKLKKIMINIINRNLNHKAENKIKVTIFKDINIYLVIINMKNNEYYLSNG
jgi:hypothetical protein